MRGTEWLAGILEGEGCFGSYRSGRGKAPQPTIRLVMNDLDVVRDVADKFGTNVSLHKRPADRPQWKNGYTTAKFGVGGLSIMIDVFPHMGNRRRQKIEQILSAWEHSGRH